VEADNRPGWKKEQWGEKRETTEKIKWAPGDTRRRAEADDGRLVPPGEQKRFPLAYGQYEPWILFSEIMHNLGMI
jgi:hypothetical protein